MGGTCAWKLCVTDPSMAYTIVLEVSNQVGHIKSMLPCFLLTCCHTVTDILSYKRAFCVCFIDNTHMLVAIYSDTSY